MVDRDERATTVERLVPPHDQRYPGIADDESRGVHAFLVPIRDETAGEALPGVTIGDDRW